MATPRSSHRTGSCLCGAVTFTFKPKEEHFDACHCTMCQRWSAGPAFAIQADGRPDIEGLENVSSYPSSEWGRREFCKVCGSQLFWRAPDFGYEGVSVGAIDNIDGLAFTKELFIDLKPTQYGFSQDTQKMTQAQVEAMFAGEGDGSGDHDGGDGDG